MIPFEKIDWKSLSYEERDNLLIERYAAYEKSIQERGGKRPKREGFLMERIASFDNIKAADHDAQIGKAKRTIYINGIPKKIPNKYVRIHNENAEEELRKLQLMLLTLEFPEQKFKIELIKSDAGKWREIIKQDFYPWHILEHSIMRVIQPYIFNSLINDTCACIKGKGLHFGVKRLSRKLRLHHELQWFWKTDFKKFYPSIPHIVVMDNMRKLFKDKTFLKLVEIVFLEYESTETITPVLNDEKEKFKRNPYWCYFEPNFRESFAKPIGSCNED